MTRRNLLFEIPGKATNRPITMDSKAAKIDKYIVEVNPPIKNFMLVNPDFVEGSITYQPHVPEVELHPVSKINKQVDKIKLFLLIWINALIFDLKKFYIDRSEGF